MYERFFGLRERPFELTPNPRYLLLTRAHREALSNLEYGMTSRRSVTMLVGEAGTGKTTLLRRALGQGADADGRRVRAICLTNPILDRREFLDFLATTFGLSEAAAVSKSRLLRELEDALRRSDAAGETTVLVIDEAQSLPPDLFEEIRLLANIESDTEKLLPLVLAGQPELAERMNQPELRQLKQRIALRCTLPALTLVETAEYIAGRIRIAGGDAGQIFSRDAVIAVFQHARGIPRTISVICDNALLTGFAVGQRPVDAQVVVDVCRDFDLQGGRPDRPPVIAAAPGDAVRRFATGSRRTSEKGWSLLGTRAPRESGASS